MPVIELASDQGWPGPLRIAALASCTRFLACNRYLHATASPSIKGTRLQWLNADCCPCGSNASQGEPTARPRDSVQPPEQRAVRGLLACSRYVHATASPSRAKVVDGGCLPAPARVGGMQAKASPPGMRRASIGSGSTRTALYGIISGMRFARMQSLCPCNRIPIRDIRLSQGGELRCYTWH